MPCIERGNAYRDESSKTLLDRVCGMCPSFAQVSIALNVVTIGGLVYAYKRILDLEDDNDALVAVADIVNATLANETAVADIVNANMANETAVADIVNATMANETAVADIVNATAAVLNVTGA